MLDLWCINLFCLSDMVSLNVYKISVKSVGKIYISNIACFDLIYELRMGNSLDPVKTSHPCMKMWV